MTENEKIVAQMNDHEMQYTFELCCMLLDVSNIRMTHDNTAFLLGEISEKWGGIGLGSIATALANTSIEWKIK